MKNICLILSLFICFVTSCKSEMNEAISKDQAIKVELIEENGRYQILRGGEPYSFNGAGLSGDIETLKAHGGTSIRTWSENSEILDVAHEHGMTVMMCFYIRPERHGMDYENEEEKNKQFERVQKFVLANKDHPALLSWCIGNELNLSYTNPKVYDEVNRISKWIHKVDPNHLTTTTISSMNSSVVKEIKERATDIDFLSVQVYGDLFALPEMIEESEWTKPFMVTEWGTIGHWEMESTAWGAPIEQTSTEKANTYLKGYKKSIEPYANQCIGNYVFLWGQKQERTPTWYGMFLEGGQETETIDMMHYIWNNAWPDNRTPRLDSMTLDGQNSRQNIVLIPSAEYESTIQSSDYEGDSLTYEWVLMRESTETKEGGDREEKPEELMVEKGTKNSITLKTPMEEGAYRLFGYVHDGNNHSAHANIPFLVKNSN